MSKKIAYILAGGALVALMQWAVPAAYSAVAGDEAAQTCPAGAESCPISEQNTEAEV